MFYDFLKIAGISTPSRRFLKPPDVECVVCPGGIVCASYGAIDFKKIIKSMAVTDYFALDLPEHAINNPEYLSYAPSIQQYLDSKQNLMKPLAAKIENMPYINN